MAFETKVILVAMAEIVKKSATTEEVYKALENMAKVEGIKLEPFREEDGDK